MNSKISLDEIKESVKKCLDKTYSDDIILFERNRRKGLSERCIVFRFAHYLQNELHGWFVDCDFNSSSINNHERSGKPIVGDSGRITKRFIDIIVHKRDFRQENDFLCFEIKKWNNYSRSQQKKDLNNLKRLTTDYGYNYGFYIILGKERGSAKWMIFKNGQILRGRLMKIF